ncbi:dihydroneopterin aldolase [Hoeflea prorocentri]|uniref:7,8-dihydroneopterin aldolase n=1 Tax=Hoeflea prorocentri TaxID=1922333 RepID=A0A9X3UJL6_9HYPH|nr:dihydroneopterin aldolase [Hoeflea prorocentri]MCY6380329.1 dihydroneopterin aldolase [Hoeflea prorocentri]MDA5398129.1 dihydroneopterin aldolase [Hoeflea prorocentri]
MSETYRIGLKNCVFFARHGVFEAEAQLGQSFHVDIDMDVACGDALQSDNPGDAVDYGAVHTSVQEIVTGERFKLIEALAYKIGQALCMQFPAIRKVMVTIRKPGAPIEGVFDHAEVRVEYVSD